MKVSTRGRYGLKAMVDLAFNSQNFKCVSLKSIAKRQGIPENYLEQLMVVLKKSDIVKSIRGSKGGYILNKSPEHISVGDLLRVLEGSINLVDCNDEVNGKKCGEADCSKCDVKNVWALISQRLSEAADSITLKDLIIDK